MIRTHERKVRQAVGFLLRQEAIAAITDRVFSVLGTCLVTRDEAERLQGLSRNGRSG